MKLKKLLSFALALAMVLAFVPALSLTASATDVTDYTTVFNGSREGDGAVEISTTWATNASLSTVWSGWSTSTTGNILVNGQGYTVDGTVRNVIQFYNSATGTDSTATVTMPGYASGAENMVLQWYFKRSMDATPYGYDTSTNTANYGDFVFYDNDGAAIASFTVDHNTAYGVKLSEYTAANPFGWPDEGALLEIAFLNNEANNNVDVVYSIDGTTTYSTTIDSFNGVKTLTGMLGQYNASYNHIGFGDLMVYATYPDTVKTVTVHYTVDSNTVGTVTKSYDTANNETYASFDAYYYSPDGTNVMYAADAANHSENDGCDTDEDGNHIVALGALDNPDVNNYAYGDTFISDGSAYKIVSNNLIPNGTFQYGLNGWYNGSTTAATSTYFTVNGDGTITGLKSQNQTSAGSLLRSWSIESDKTYLFTYTDNMNAGDAKYRKISLANDTAASDGEVISATSTAAPVIVFTNTSGYSYVKASFRWIDGDTFGNFGLYELEDITPTVNYVDDDGNIVATAKATVDDLDATYDFDAAIFYSEDYPGLYTADAETGVAIGETRETYADLDEDKIVPTRDGFITPNCSDSAYTTLSSAEYYINSDNENSILVDGVTTSDPFDVFQYLDADAASGNSEVTVSGVTAKTRIGYLEFDVPSGFAKDDPITLTLNSYQSYGVADSKIAAIATTLDLSGVSNGSTTAASSFDLELVNPDSEVYYSAALTGEDDEVVTINLTGIEAVDGKVKVILVIPQGYIWFANEEKTVLGGTYQGQTAYVEVTASEPVAANVALTDSDGNTVYNYTIDEVPYTPDSITIPAGIYMGINGGQYYLDADADVPVELNDEKTAVTGTLAIDELELFSWNNNAIVSSSNGETTTYNMAVSASWNTARTAYAYADVPAITDETKTLQVTIEAWYNNVSSSQPYNQVPDNIILYAADDYDSIKNLDLTKGSETTAALEAVQFEQCATIPVLSELTDGENLDSSTGIGTISVKLTSDMGVSGPTAFKLVVDSGIATVRSIKFEEVTKDVGVTVIDGAQIRIGDGVSEEELLGDSGLRFIATIDSTNKLAGVSNAIVGIAISADNTFDPDVDTLVPADDYQDGESKSIFTVAVTDIKPKNYNVTYYAFPYVQIGEGDDAQYYYGDYVARTPYQVAAGILVSSTSDSAGTDSSGYGQSTDDTDILYGVLNVYANKTGARLTLTADTDTGYIIGIADYANDAKEFFTVDQEVITNSEDEPIGKTVTLTASGMAEFYSYWQTYLRVDNNNSLAVNHITNTSLSEDGTELSFEFYFDIDDMPEASE